MNVNIADLVNKTKALYATLKDPSIGWYAKFRAFTDFATYCIQFLPDITTMPALQAGQTPETALAALEGLSARKGADHAPTDAEICDHCIRFLVTITPLDCCE